MDKIVSRFLKMYDISNTVPFEKAYLTKSFVNPQAQTIDMIMTLENILPYKLYVELFEKTSTKTEKRQYTCNIIYKYKSLTNISSLIEDMLVNELYSFFKTSKDKKFSINEESKQIIFNYDSSNEEDINTVISKISKFLKDINVEDFKIIKLFKENSKNTTSKDNENLKNSVSDYDDSYFDQDYGFEEDFDDDIVVSNIKMTSMSDKNEELSKYEAIIEEQNKRLETRVKQQYRETQEQLLKKSNHNSKELISIKDCYQFDQVTVEGTVFNKNLRTTKNNRNIFTLEITDNTSSLTINTFEKKNFSLELFDSIAIGDKIRVFGDIAYDEYANDTLMRPISIKKVEKDPLRMDTYEGEKRVELHLHTKMSTLDAVSTIKDYVNAAKRFGMKGIAVTDHGVAQSFPACQDAVKGTDIKMIYGCEVYQVEDEFTHVFNPSDIVLADAEFLAFDLETTGLSARYDRIIEFGAYSFSKQGLIDNYDFFINPDIKLPDKIIKLTGITNEMVEGGKPIKRALEMILKIIKGKVLVTHNATFDIGFLNEALKNNGLPTITNPVIDTLPLSRYTFPTHRDHRLGSLCANLGVFYDEESAHRADYDAKVLAESFLVMLDNLTKNNAKLTHKDLQLLQSKDAISLSRPVHTTLYAKNEQGLKDLFKIISEAHVNYFKGVPRVPRSLIVNNRENLIVGSACFNGELFQTAMTRSEETLSKVMDFYDFVEIQPYTNYSHLVGMGELASYDQVKMILKDIISLAKRKGKIVCATSDCHYVEPEQKIFRDICIYAKRATGEPHPLNPYKRKKLPPFENPDQYFLTTAEMLDKFSFLEDEELIKEIVITNTHKIMDMCDSIKPCKDKLYTPNIPHCKENLLDIVYTNAKKLYGDPLPEPIKDRLEAELKGIDENNYYVIYYIAHKLVTISNERGYLVGSRGSVGSSLVATMANITEVNPLPPHYICPKCHHLEWVDVNEVLSGFDLPNKVCPDCGTMMKGDGQNIPFATFLGFKAEKVPDIDLNFPSDFQAEAHELTKELLGVDNVFKAGTLETVAEKTAIGYVKGYYEFMNKDWTLVPRAEINRLAIGCTDVKRTTGQHPGGIIVIPSDMSVYDFTPIQFPADKPDKSWKTTHFSYKAIHDNVLKLDLLGHLDPYAIKIMCNFTGLNFKDVPFNDPNVMKIFTDIGPLKLKRNILNEPNGALGLPEFGSSLGRRILNETKPKTFDDLVRISGLSHGTGVYQGNAQDFILSGKGTLHDVIGCRDDIMTVLHDKYGFESIDSFKLMEIVRKGNFTKPAFKETNEMFTKMMLEHNVPQYFIDSCNKIQYLFPKGHAVAYCSMAVRVAWFKVYHPLAYYATYFSIRCNQYDLITMCQGLDAIKRKYDELKSRDKLDVKDSAILDTLTVCIEMYDRGYEFENLNINKSDAIYFTINKETNKIIPSLVAVDGLGESTAQQIVNNRNQFGKFVTVEDFKNRTSCGETLEKLLRNSHAFDGLEETNQMTLFDDFFGDF